MIVHASTHTAPVIAPGEVLVAVRNLTREFDVSAPWIARVVERRPRQTIRAVEDVSFEIARGRTLGLVGESGCGKSTVARCLAGLVAPTRGEFSYAGRVIDVSGSWDSRSRRGIQMIFQDPYASLNPRWRVEQTVGDPLLAFGLVATRREMRANVARLLQDVGLAAGDARKYPHEFSGGQRQRIAIARALASRPEFLICDEPTSALDVSVQAQILNLMRRLQREHRLTYLFISHNLAVIDHMADDVGVMYLGRLVELRPKNALFSQPRHPYTQLLIKTVPSVQAIGRRSAPLSGEVPDPIDPPSGCAFHPRCPLATDRCVRERPLPLPLRGGGQVACHAVEEGLAS
jgi:peptide/nickel transport system ATP-binding protein